MFVLLTIINTTIGRMALCGTASNTEAQRTNAQIDKQLRAERKKVTNEVKLLLLGMNITYNI